MNGGFLSKLSRGGIMFVRQCPSGRRFQLTRIDYFFPRARARGCGAARIDYFFPASRVREGVRG